MGDYIENGKPQNVLNGDEITLTDLFKDEFDGLPYFYVNINNEEYIAYRNYDEKAHRMIMVIEKTGISLN